jgi:hypothetical protein
MIAFAVIMRAELGQGPGQRAFAEQNQLRQTLLLDGPNPTFRKGLPFGGTAASQREHACAFASTDVSGWFNS